MDTYYKIDKPQKHYAYWKKKKAIYDRPNIVLFNLHKIARKGKAIETENRLMVA